VLTGSLNAQTAVPDENGHLVFKSNVHTVVVDIVVIGRNGKAATGLKKDDFVLTEDGRPQKLSYFEEHTGKTEPVSLPNLPPNIFTNIPRVTPTDSVTVLLLDALNTQVKDQARVHAQILKYLKTMQPGRRVAIFTLGNRLRFIQGFTDDSALLVAALNNPKNGSGLTPSSVLKSPTQVAAENEAISMLGQAPSGTPDYAVNSALNNLTQFQAEQSTSQQAEATEMTLQAFQELGNYLAGVPGRKNVIWFSSAFPLILFPNPSLNDEFAVNREFGEEVRKTDALLSAAQVAIYPIASEGLDTDSLTNADQRTGAVVSGQQVASQPQLSALGASVSQQAIQAQTSSLNGDANNRNAAHTAMDEVARDTGGEAIYNTNDLNDAISRVIDHASTFYTVTYTPARLVEDGQFRKIQVKLAKDNASYRLSYRRGYYADKAPRPGGNSAAELKAAGAKLPADPLHPFMGPGMPASTQIPLALRILASKPTPQAEAPKPASAGDNPEVAKGAGPLTRYSVDFIIAARGLQLDPAPNDGRHGVIEATLLVYSVDGRPLNWLVRQVNLDMDEARYAKVQANGVNFRLDIDVPVHGASIRAGVYDKLSNLAGTLEVPLSAVTPVPAAGHAMR
jgi:VWFA-related protein